MSHSECHYERQVIEAVRQGIWTDELKSHLASCDSCQESALISLALAEMFNATVLPGTLPDARLLWLKAQVMKKQRQSAALESCLAIGTGLVALVATIAVLVWAYPTIAGAQGPAGGDFLSNLLITLPFAFTGVILYGLKLLNPTRARMRGLI